MEKTIELLPGVCPSTFLQLFGEYVRDNKSDILKEVDVPTLVIAGENDRIVDQRFQRRLHKKIKNSQFALIRKGSHFPQLDKPIEVNRMIKKFLSESKVNYRATA